MITQTKNKEDIKKAIGSYADEIVGLDISEWVSREGNVALSNDKGDVSLFERQYRSPKIVCGHYFFFSRGRDAIDAAKGMLKEIFIGDYGVEVIVGLTPMDNKGALWMNTHLGFTSHGTVDTDVGDCRFVILTKKDWENMNNG